MKKQFLIGMVVASFSLSAYSQSQANPALAALVESMEKQDTGASVQMGKNGFEATAGDAKASVNMGMGLGGDGIGNGAPDMSGFQAQAIANAQALDKPVDLRSAPDGAEAILKLGANALQIKDTTQLQSVNQPFNSQTVPSEFLADDKSNSNGSKISNNTKNVTAMKVVEPIKPNIYTTDISSWNRTTIEQFEKEGKERTENNYKEFLSKQ